MQTSQHLQKFEEGKGGDGQTGNASQDEDDGVDPGGIGTRLKGGKILLLSESRRMLVTQQEVRK